MVSLDITRRGFIGATAWSAPVVSLSTVVPHRATSEPRDGLLLRSEYPSVLQGGVIRATASATDARGRPAPGVPVSVSVTVEGTTYSSATGVTNGAGEFVTYLGVPVGFAGGNALVTAQANALSAATGVDIVPASVLAPFDWRGRARDYDAFVYDWSAPGEYSTISVDRTHYNIDFDSYKLPSYYGDPRVDVDGGQEALGQLSSIIGATLVGIDKSAQDGRNYVDMCRTFFHPDLGVALNNPVPWADAGFGSFFYAQTVNVLMSMIAALYPGVANYTDILRSIADRHYDMVVQLGGAQADFTGQGFDFRTMSLNPGNRNEGGEGAAGTALILTLAYSRLGDDRYLDGAKWSLGYLDRSSVSMNYEWAINTVPYVAAWLNTHAGTSFDVSKHLSFLFQQSAVRQQWRTLGGSWNGYDITGLQGNPDDGGGYAFAMGTYSMAFLAPAVKYDVRYADLVGLLLTRVANAARFFYADQIPSDHQYYGSQYVDDPAHVISYEGLRASEEGQSPRATGDPTHYRELWHADPRMTDLGLYGGGWVGLLGATLDPLGVGLLRIDVDALDLTSTDDLVRSLYVNTGIDDTEVTVPVSGTRALYDVLTDRVLAESVSGSARIALPRGAARLIIEVPVGSPITRSQGRTLIGGTVVNYRSRIDDPALGRPVSASSTAAGSSAASVTDGDPTSSWVSGSGGEHWVDVDLGQPTSFSGLRLRASGASDRTVAVSADGSSYTTVWSGAAVADEIVTDGVVFAPVVARHVRVVMNGGSAPHRIESLEVVPGNLAERALVVVSSSSNALTGLMMTDGDAWSRWESRASDAQWAFVDLGRQASVGTVIIRWEFAAAAAYDIEVSNDAQSWTIVASTENGQGGDEILTFAQVSARFVKLSCRRRKTIYAYSVFEFAVFA